MDRDFMEFCWLVSVFSLTQAKRRGEFPTEVTERGTPRVRRAEEGREGKRNRENKTEANLETRACAEERRDEQTQDKNLTPEGAGYTLRGLKTRHYLWDFDRLEA
jgi:hypothetical protein